MTKPLQYDEVLARINTHLTIRNLRRDLQEQIMEMQLEIVQRKEVQNALLQRCRDLQARNDELEAFVNRTSQPPKSVNGKEQGTDDINLEPFQPV